MSMLRPGGGSEGDAGDPCDGYDRFGRVQEMRWQKTSDSTPIDAWQWGFNEASNRTWKKNLVASSGQDEAYGHDGLYQVIRDAVGTLNTNRTAIGGVPGEEEDFSYDPTGNWLGYRKSEDGAAVLNQSRSNNQDNQLTQIDGSSALLSYDRAGNATKVPPGTGGHWSKYYQPIWDAWGRLVEVKDETGTPAQKNTYDGLTRRITKESSGTVTHTYWSDRWKPVEERIDTATTAARSYLWGERPGHRDELILRDRDTDGNGSLDERLYATMDYFNGTAILNTSGVVQERYAYSAFGVRRIMAADFSPRADSDFEWDFGFQGQFRDNETGWSNYSYRFYVPELGRWINRDPIGETGGENLYAFVGNQAPNAVDWLGLAGNETTRKVGKCEILLVYGHGADWYDHKFDFEDSCSRAGFLGCGMKNSMEQIPDSQRYPSEPGPSGQQDDTAIWERLKAAVRGAKEEAKELCTSECCKDDPGHVTLKIEFAPHNTFKGRTLDILKGFDNYAESLGGKSQTITCDEG